MKTNKVFIFWLKWPIYLRIAFIVLIIVILFGEFISLLEPQTFASPFDGIWWAFITISTVGYGDFVPETLIGKTTTILLILLGASFITSFFAHLSAAAIYKQRSYIEGSVSFQGNKHIVIIGWNEKSKNLLTTLQKIKPEYSIVLIDETLEETPFLDEHIHFVKGSPSWDSTLHKGNIKEAEAIFITPDQHKSELEADMQSILTLIAVKGLNPSIYAVCEILTEPQTMNAYRAGADELIRSFELTSQVMVNSYVSKGGLSEVFSEFNPANGHFFALKEASDECINQNFYDLHQKLLKEGILLLGIKRQGKTYIHPPLTFIFSKGDLLLVLTS
ncbi:potassium channel family protein [Bacillus carboniphilus]|uniref:Potassium channel family protein n=1 Tax=Bacillus carboniphilus TaxID=86663 RepID=A0ABY9JU95_9BACI|nr:potassium channel family protein [Bacillus carboniphilus]WLR41240.1 potassium channel family protein [Bacillus carboniphilus]